MFAGNFAPANWALCNGQLLPIAQYDTLFALIGTVYGGDGQTSFALPDLRGRVPVGQGTGPGLTPRTIGERFGADTVMLTTQQLPNHTHNFFATTAAGEGISPANNLFANTGGDVIYVPSPTGPELKTMDPKTVTNVGGSQPHDNIMPSVAMNYIICLFGIFPSRN